MIAFVRLPSTKRIPDLEFLCSRLRGIQHWEIESQAGVYFALEPWMSKPRIAELYQALRRTLGGMIRFGAAEQKTTARAAALYRSVPHCTIVSREQTENFLSHLPIRYLPGVGQRASKFLESRGIDTFVDFRRLPYSTIKNWFGVSGIILQQFARGIDPRIVQPRSRFQIIYATE